jgi:hypothetical protein
MNQLTPTLATNVKIGDVSSQVRLGDTVWFYANCNFESTPQVGVLVKLQESNIVDLFLMPCEGFRTIPQRGIHLAGDPRLDNPNVRAKGCWTPRPTAEQLGLGKA